MLTHLLLVEFRGPLHFLREKIQGLPEFNSVKPLVGKRVGPPEPRAGVFQKLGVGVEVGVVFLGSPMTGSQESVWNGHRLKSVSSFAESAYVAVSSRGDKMQLRGK